MTLLSTVRWSINVKRPVKLLAESMTRVKHRPNSSNTILSPTLSVSFTDDASSTVAMRHVHAASMTSVVTREYAGLNANSTVIIPCQIALIINQIWLTKLQVHREHYYVFYRTEECSTKCHPTQSIMMSTFIYWWPSLGQSSSSSRMRVINHNWSATKYRPHPQSVAEISRHSVLSGDRIRQCETSSGSRHKDTDQCL